MFFSKIRVLLLVLFCSLLTFSAFAQGGTTQLLQKSEEAFNTQRWKSAGTLYDMLLKDTVNYSPLMAKALLADELAADEVSLARARELFMRNRFRIDSLVHDFSSLCIRLHHFDIFEESLDRIRKGMPEHNDLLLSKMIHYRVFLRQPKDVIRVAQMARRENPDNLKWIKLEASGWQLLGEASHALPVFRQILQRDPDDLESLLFMGNYYYLTGKEKLQKVETDYSKQRNNATRMQYAAYRSQIQLILDEDLSRASDLLERANQLNPNNTVANTLYDIYVMRSEVAKANKMKKSKTR